MNTLVIVLIAAVCLIAGYTFYGSWLAKKWGIDPKAKTPAVAKNDGQDYVPTDGWTVFAHQFSSIAGAGPVTGAIQAAVFGWVPVLLWILIGGIFFGAVTDFGALYASVKNEGKSMGLLIEKYIGKTGKKLFLLFCWLFTLIVIAAFADMVAGTFNAYETVDGVTKLSAQATVNGAAVYRFCCCLRTAPEKTAVERLERNGTRPCLHCCSLCNRHECTACNKQSNLDLSGICLHLSCRCPSDVASDAAA
mgnify:CR=1 FL=1